MVGAALGVMLLTLSTVGLLTATLLHVRSRHALDRALLAAAFAEAHPWQEERYVNDTVESPVAVRPWTPGDPEISAAMHAAALAREEPTFFTRDHRRILLLVVESGASHEHVVVVATADAVTLWNVALPFAGIYSLVALTVSLVAALGLRVVLVRALDPLARATRAVESVRGLGSDVRLDLAGLPEVDALLASTNALLARLDRAYRSQSTFTAEAAHELRTPVTSLKGELELALRRERPAVAYREALERAAQDVERLAGLVEGLMLLARVEAGQAEQGRTDERLSAVVHEALRRERATIEEAGNDVELELVADPEVRIQVDLVTIAVANLLRNAARHAPGTRIEVRIGGGGKPLVEVEDGGPGLDSDERVRVMERFARGGARQGLGLGLPLSREIARRHGGDLVLLQEERGLRAVLTLSSDSNVPLRLHEGGQP